MQRDTTTATDRYHTPQNSRPTGLHIIERCIAEYSLLKKGTKNISSAKRNNFERYVPFRSLKESLIFVRADFFALYFHISVFHRPEDHDCCMDLYLM